MTHGLSRRRLLAAAGVTALAGCTSVGSRSDRGSGSRGGGSADGSGSGSGNDGTASGGGSGSSGNGGSIDGGSSGDDGSSGDESESSDGSGSPPPLAAQSLPITFRPDVLRGRAVSGGVPKDGIPSIDNPSFWSASEADSNLDANSIVFGLVRNGEAKAYPQSILVWHEVCNDTIGGEAVSVTYCPLTGTVLGFKRGGTTFGVSGRLVNNNLIMYDRATENWWPQVLGTAIPGWGESLVGRSLQDFRLVWTEWKLWKKAHPDTTVLSTDTGHARNYNRDPYGSYSPRGGYYAPDQKPLFSAMNSDDRFPPKEVFIGARAAEGAIAFHKDTLREQKLIEGTMGEVPVVAVYDKSLDTGYVYRNPDEVSFRYANGKVDGPDGTTAPKDLPLDEVMTLDSMWFAWIGFYPDSEIHA